MGQLSAVEILRAKIATAKAKQLVDASNPPTSLLTYLYIYSQASDDCYLDHMHGARALKHYLGRISYPTAQFPEILNTNFKVPEFLCSYQYRELAKILSGYRRTNDLAALALAERAMYFVITKQLVQLLY